MWFQWQWLFVPRDTRHPSIPATQMCSAPPWPCVQSGYINPAISGVPYTQHGRGGGIRSGCLTHAISGAHSSAKWLHNPVPYVRRRGRSTGHDGPEYMKHWCSSRAKETRNHHNKDDITGTIMGQCLAIRVGKAPHSYHPKGFYTSARSPGGREGRRKGASERASE